MFRTQPSSFDLRFIFRFIFLAISAVLAVPFHARTAAADPPNILWLIGEDLGPHLSCYGTQEVWTPNLDRMAEQGMRFTRCYNGMVCSVSRSSFMTGMYATSIGAHNHRTTTKQPLPEGVKTLCQWLKQQGYFTANLRQLPTSCGFRGSGKTDWNFTVEDPLFDSDRWSDLKDHQPFYAQINFSETHRAYTAPKKANPDRVEIPPYYPDHSVTRQDWAAYLDEASELDRKIGLVLENLQRDGLLENTVVVFFGDNGQSHVRGKQFLYEEGQHVPLIIRWPKNHPAPMGWKPGQTDSRMIHGIDLAPTMIDIAGGSKPAKMQGQIFLGARAEPPREYIFGHRDRCDMTQMRLRSVRDARYRYIRNFTPWVPFLAFNEYKEKQYPVWNLLKQFHAQGKLTAPQAFLCQDQMPEEELYDLQTDPWQLINLADSSQAEHQAARGRLSQALADWIRQTGDQGQTLESLEQLVASEKRFVAQRDWRPDPRTKTMAARANNPAAFEPQELETKLQVGYAVRTLDLNGDRRLDIAVVDSKRVLWLENPTWKEHVIHESPDARFDNVCFAPHDINQDGLIDFALGADWQPNNTESGGSIGWLENKPDGKWPYHTITAEPTTHRMQWVDLRGAGRPDLVVAPLKGRGTKGPGWDQSGLRLLALSIPSDPRTRDWPSQTLTDQLPVMHNMDVIDLDRNRHNDLLLASYRGVHWLRTDAGGATVMTRLGKGQEQAPPAAGASEIRLGTLASGRRYIATVEPWHGDKIVVYVEPIGWSSMSNDLWPRTVLDEELAWGHAVACANLDNDEDQELIVGVRDDRSDQHRRGVRIYDPVPSADGANTGPTWRRTLLDPGAVAVEDLAAADLDGDGKVDIVAVGRATHNVKIYWNR